MTLHVIREFKVNLIYVVNLTDFFVFLTKSERGKNLFNEIISLFTFWQRLLAIQNPVPEAIFFAVGALTLSVLFAVHCGLVTFGVVEEEQHFETL